MVGQVALLVADEVFFIPEQIHHSQLFIDESDVNADLSLLREVDQLEDLSVVSSNRPESSIRELFHGIELVH